MLKAPTEGYDSNLTDEENTDGRHTERQPQQPTITDFMGYTRPQLEQMIVMFQNELVRRGHPSGEPEVNIPNRDDYMTGTGMSSDAPPESVKCKNPTAYRGWYSHDGRYIRIQTDGFATCCPIINH